jgi:hypothetical protein
MKLSKLLPPDEIAALVRILKAQGECVVLITFKELTS